MKQHLSLIGLIALSACLHVATPASAASGPSAIDDTGHGLALTYYEQSEMSLAAQGFLTQAKLGSAAAQRNLGLMLAKGEGLDRNIQQAYLWLQSAAQQGDTQAKTIADVAYKQMSASEQAVTDNLLPEFLSRYAAQTVLESLMPMLDREQLDHRSLYGLKHPAVKRVVPKYPADMIRGGDFGSVLVELTITTQGIPRSPRIVMATDARFFVEAARVLPRWRLMPPDEHYDARQLFNFLIGGRSSTASESERVLLRYKEKADNGSPDDITTYALLLRAIPEGGPSQQPVISTELMADAAMQGAPLARHPLADALEHGYGCDRDEAKALAWRHLAANQGVPAARYLLAVNASNPTEQLFWLQSAANVGSAEASVHLAWLQSIQPAAAYHDPASAVQMLEAVENAYGDRIAWLEARAAAAAASGDFVKAKYFQKRALKHRKRFRWPMKVADHLLSEYSQGRALALATMQPPWLIDEPGMLVQ